MCDQTQVTYKPNDVVWVKLSSVWWPAQVQDQETLDKEVTQGLKKKPLAVVKFFNEEFYEFIKNLDQIYHYNCLKKNEFIQKGLDMCRPKTSRSIPSSMVKFPEDIRQAELITGGNPDICDDPMFKSKTEEKMDTNFSEHGLEYLKTPKSAMKRSQKGLSGEPSRKHIRFSLPPQTLVITDAEPSTSRATKSASRPRSTPRQPKSRPSTSNSAVMKKPLINVNFSPRPISEEMAEKIKKKNYQANIRIQPSSKSTPSPNKEKMYTCFRCFDTTNRLSLLIDHYRAHELHGMNVPPMSPKIPKVIKPKPGPSSKDKALFTPNVKSEKQKVKISRKSNSETSIKKKIKKDETQQLEEIISSKRTPYKKKKQKKSKSKHVEVDQNKVLREKILKDWDDESDEELNCGSKIFRTTAEIHSSSTDRITTGSLSPQTDLDSTLASTQDNNEMETTVSSTNDIIESEDDCNNEMTREDDSKNEVTREDESQNEETREDVGQNEVTREDESQNEVTREDDSQNEITREDDSRNEVTRENDSQNEVTQEDDIQTEVTQEDDIQTEVTDKENVKKEGTSCFDFEDNDEAINLDQTHKFGQKLPRVINEDKTKKSTNQETESEVNKLLESSEDNCAVIENKVLELLEVTKMSDVPVLPKGLLTKKLGKKKKGKAKNYVPSERTKEKICEEKKDESNEGTLENTEEKIDIKSLSEEKPGEIKVDFVPEKNELEISQEDILEEIEKNEIDVEAFSPQNENNDLIANQDTEESKENYDNTLQEKTYEVKETEIKNDLTSEQQSSLENQFQNKNALELHLGNLESAGIDKATSAKSLDKGPEDVRLIMDQDVEEENTSRDILEKECELKEKDDFTHDKEYRSQTDDHLQLTVEQSQNNFDMNEEDLPQDNKSTSEKNLENNVEIDHIIFQNNEVNVKECEVGGDIGEGMKGSIYDGAEFKVKEDMKEIVIAQEEYQVESDNKEENKIKECEKEEVFDDCKVTIALEKECLAIKEPQMDHSTETVERQNQNILEETKIEIEQERQDFEEEDCMEKEQNEFESADVEPKNKEDSDEMIPEEQTAVSNQVIDNEKEEDNEKSANEDLLDEVNKEVEIFVELETKNENNACSEESGNIKLWEIGEAKTDQVLKTVINDSCEQLEESKEKQKLLTEKVFMSFEAGVADEEIEISTVDISGAFNVKEDKDDKDLTKLEIKETNYKVGEVDNELNNSGEQLLRSEVIVEDVIKDAEEMNTSEPKTLISDVSSEGSNSALSKNAPDTEPANKMEKCYTVPELGAFSNELINVSTDLQQWTAMEYYADLEAQVRNDVDVEETKHLDGQTACISKETPSKENQPNFQETTVNEVSRNEKELDIMQDNKTVEGNEASNKISEKSKGREVSEVNKPESTDTLSKSKSPDCTKSRVIYDFKLDFPEPTVNEIPTRVSKSKKRKWESKDPNDRGILEFESSYLERIEKKTEEKREEFVTFGIEKDSEKLEESSDMIENIPHLDHEDVANKKLKLDMSDMNEAFKDDQDEMSTEVRDEITISQDAEVTSEIIVSTSEENIESLDSHIPSLKTSEASLGSSKVIKNTISTTLPPTATVEKEDFSSETKLQLDLITTNETEMDKKETTTTSFDPSQLELDINSMPVVIEEDLMQDIKLTPVTTTKPTRPHLKQYRILLRKPGESSPSLLPGNKNGKIIRIPGISKEPVVTKKTQMASTSKIQAIPNLISQRTVTSGNQTMLLKMNTIPNSGQAKYAVGKSQLRSALTTTGTSGQPLEFHLIQPPQKQNSKLLVQPQQKPIAGKVTSRVISKHQATPSDPAGSKQLATATKTGQKLIINQKRQIISSKNIISKTRTVAVSKPTSISQKNSKSLMVTASAIEAHPKKSVGLLSAVQGTSGTTAVQVVSQTPKVIMQRKTKSLTGTVAPVKNTQAGTIFIHTSQGLVPASKTVTKQILNQIPQIPTQASPRPPQPVAPNVKRPPVNKSRQANINILQRSQKKNNNRQQSTVQTAAVQQQGKQQVLSIPVSSIPSHELILNNVPVQFQNIGTAQPDLKMLYLVDEHGQYHQVDNSPLIAIDNSGDNRGVYIESNSTNEVDNLFLTFGEPSVVNVTTSTTTPSQDILAKALANTQVLQSDTTDIPDAIEGSTLYVDPQYPAPTLTHNVLETSFSLNPPIMTPLEVPSSVSPQITTMTSNLLPATTVVQQTVGKKTDAQPSMPLLTDEVEVATGQAVFLDSSTLVAGTSQPLTFQVINSDGNIVVASAPSSSSQTITNPVTSNKTANQVVFSTDLLKSESRHVSGNKSENIVGNIEDLVTTSGTSDLNDCSGVTLSLESNPDSIVSVEGNRQIIQSLKTTTTTRARDKRSRKGSIHSEKQIKNIIEVGGDISSHVYSTDNLNTSEILLKRLQGTLSEKRETEDKGNTSQQSRSAGSNKTINSFTYAQPIVSADNEAKFIVEEKR